ncbi:hypothetical protein P167DRAFT_497669, partial [Morchella conica CCBAS932]
GLTPLSWAAMNGHGKVVKLLLEREDVDVNSKDKNGKIALELAAERRHTNVMELLRVKSEHTDDDNVSED